MNELKPNYSELSRIHECDRRTIKKYFNGYTETKLDIYEDEIKEKLKIPGITVSALYNYLNIKYSNIGSYTNLMTFIRKKIKTKQRIYGTFKIRWRCNNSKCNIRSIITSLAHYKYHWKFV